MSDVEVCLKTMVDLQEESAKFFIDAYQRGYRWTENEVRDLLDDIWDFRKEKNDEKFYCLQPIVVTRAEDGISWKVIDGQQRLTTLYLIYSYYYATAGKLDRELWKQFELSYDNKPMLQECLRIFREREYISSETITQEMSKYENDIDCHYIIEAYKCICDFFKLLHNPAHQNDQSDMKKIFDSRMKIIWYEIKNCDIAKEISFFSKINMGKIALTNAELIKALLLKKDENDSDKLESTQINIAVRWDEIEACLSDEGFWSFLVNEKCEDATYATRIDFVFRVMAKELNDGILLDANKSYPKEEPYTVSESVNKDKFSFYVFNNYFRLLEKHPDKNSDEDRNYIETIWDGVSKYYRMFKDWYKNINWYHMIGFLVETTDENYIDLILELSRLYEEGSGGLGNGHKDHFEQGLRARISKAIFGGDNCPTVSSCKDFITGLEYGRTNDEIRKTLLLYNIAYLEACKENGRFPFEKYKDRKLSWDIEHINAVKDTRPDDDLRDSENNERLIWLTKAEHLPKINDITTADGRSVDKLITKILDNKLYLRRNQKGTRDFIQVYEAVINHYGGTSESDNSIGNLTLLDGGTNRSYKNDVFPLKRKTIIERASSDVFVPLCTRKVFLKGFAESADLVRWESTDKDVYTKDIVDNISKYLKLEDGNE